VSQLRSGIEMLLRIKILSAMSKHGKETGKWLAFSLGGALIPVWGGMMLFRLFSKPVKFSDFSGNGEFALYSAAMLAPALYLILKDFKNSPFMYRHAFAGISALGLSLSMLLFAGVTAVHTGGLGSITLDQVFLRKITLGLFVGSVVLSFLTEVLDKQRTLEDYREYYETNQGQFKDLQEKFDELGGKNP